MWDPLGQLGQGALGPFAATAQTNPGFRSGIGNGPNPGGGQGGRGGFGGMGRMGRLGRMGEFGGMFAMPEMSMDGAMADPRGFAQAMRAWGKDMPFNMGDVRQAYRGWQGAGMPALAGYAPATDMQTQWNDWLATRPAPSGF